MKICIIVFSPSGHTLSAAENISRIMKQHGIETQLIDITREKEIFRKNRIKEFLQNRVLPHDCLFIGGPVYAGHIEQNVKKLMKALPRPDKRWGKTAVPFVTYGGVHSSIALEEAGRYLHKSGRIVVAGMKIACFHTLTRTFEKQINSEKISIDSIITECIRFLLSAKEKNDYRDIRSSFKYAGFKERFLFMIMSQNRFHKKYRTTSINPDKCTGCGICEKNCPVQIIEMIERKAAITDPNKCILCAECYHNCPSEAVRFEYCNKVKSRLENITKLESPQSKLFL